MEAAGVLIFLIFLVVIYAFFGFIWWKIFKKTGYHGALGLLMLVPIANLVALCILAFTNWPIHQQLDPAKSGVSPKPQSNGAIVAVAVVAALVGLLFIVGIVAAIAIPNFVRLREKAKTAVCNAAASSIRSGLAIYYADSAAKSEDGNTTFPASLTEADFLRNLSNNTLPVNPYGRDWSKYYNPIAGELDSDSACAAE